MAEPCAPATVTGDDTPSPRIVLDTNVCLDLFVFRDPLSSHLLSALDRGLVQAVTREDCRDEWRRVLHYPQLPIDEPLRQLANARFDASITLLEPAAATADHTLWLPRCADPDDQKFLELALAAGARWLLSKDNELLKLDRRSRAGGLFAICLPQQWSIRDLAE